MAWPAPRRPAPGGGLAVLVVVTILAALAAPHAKAVRGLVAGGLPAITAPTPPRSPAGHPAAVGAELHQRRWLPTRRRLPLPAAGPPGPHAAGRRRRPLPDPGVVPAHRPFLVRQGHPPGLQPQRLARPSTSTRSTAARSAASNPAARRLALWIGQGRAGVQPSEVGSPWPSAAGPGSATPATRGICMSASLARPRPGGGPVIALGLVRALGLRGTVILACLLVLAVTAYGVAQDLGLLEPPAQAGPGPQAGRRPAHARAGPRSPTSPPAICGCTARPAPATASPGRCWPPSARSSPTTAGSGSPGCARAATGPGPVGRCRSAVCPAARPATAWARYGRGRPHDPASAIPAAARYLVDHGARRNLDRAIYAYNHSRAYVAKVKQLARRYARGGGRR